jgi:alkylhydroperoxidase family enzyme
MARIEFAERGFGEHADWTLARPAIAVAMGGLADAVYNHSKLDVREREAARYTIALINDCAVCRATRAKGAEDAHITEGFYAELADFRASDLLTLREKLAAEFAQSFALDHLGIDDGFWVRLRGAYADEEIADLTMCCAAWLGMGRALAVIGVRAPDEHLVV